MTSRGAVVIEMPEESHWATGRQLRDSPDVSGSAAELGGRPRDSVAQRVFLGILRACALTGGGGGRAADLLHVSLAMVLSTAAAGFTLVLHYYTGVSELYRGKNIFEALAKSSIFGLMYVLMWVALMFCFITGRRRFSRLLQSAGQCLNNTANVPGYQESAQQLCREVAWLLAAAGCMTAMTVSVATYMLLVGNCQTISKCLVWQSYGIAFDIFYVSFLFIPLKFVFVGLQMNSGFRVIAAALESSGDRKAVPDGLFLDQLMSLQEDLAQLFSNLTESMSCELVAAMANGTVGSVCMWLLLIVNISADNVAAFGPMLVLYILGASVTIVLPCELVQRVLTSLRRTQSLLILAERRQPQLGQQLSLFREIVGRDLDRLGDLELFRLQRSTILSISATVLTYVIVMIQFLQS